MWWQKRRTLGARSGKATPVRRDALLSLVAVAAAAVAAWRGWGRVGAQGRGYQVVARWLRPDGEGWFVAVAGASRDELRDLGETLREEFARADTAVVMVFDDPEAARQVRRGFRVIGEERFQAALRHQRAMYVKHAARGEHRLVIYERYPQAIEVIRYWRGEDGRTPEDRMFRERPFAGEVTLVARLKRDGSAGPPSAGDLEGRVEAPVAVGRRDVEIVLDKAY